MKQNMLLKSTLTVLCGLILAACGSSGSNHHQGRSTVSSATSTVSQTASNAELTAAKAATAKAEAALAKANEELAAAKAQAEKAGATANELAAAKKAAADAEAAKKTAEAALAKANADLEAATKTTEKAIADAKKQAVEDYKKELADAAEKAKQEAEKAKLENVKKAVTASFKGDDKHFVGTQDSAQGDKVHTNILKINHTNGTASVETNSNTQPEITSITINGVRIALLENQIKANGSEKIALAKLESADFANGQLPEGAKGGWVGSWAGSRWGEFGKMRFGMYTDEKNVSHLFVNGQPASESWMTRVADGGLAYNYKGSAIIGKDGQYTPLADAITGTVDFETKKVDLNLQADADTKYNFGGDIQGNTFALSLIHI